MEIPEGMPYNHLEAAMGNMMPPQNMMYTDIHNLLAGGSIFNVGPYLNMYSGNQSPFNLDAGTGGSGSITMPPGISFIHNADYYLPQNLLLNQQVGPQPKKDEELN